MTTTEIVRFDIGERAIKMGMPLRPKITNFYGISSYISLRFFVTLPTIEPMLSAMLDPDIRRVLKRQLASAHADDPTALVADELPICRGDARADVVLVNGHISGFEIKSDRDSIQRLARQVDFYDRVFDYSTVVVAQRHFPRIRAHIPKHWGIYVASVACGEIALRCKRKSRRNTRTDVNAVVRLLWRSEAIRAANRHSLGVSRNSLVSQLWPLLIERLSKSELTAEVRMALKARASLRSDLQQSQSDDSSPIEAIDQHSPYRWCP